MGKKGEEVATHGALLIEEVEDLRSKITMMEEAMKKQTMDLKSKLAASQVKLQARSRSS
jgi:hypothetical protein